MRVNDVIITRIDGAIDSTVSSAISWMARSVTPVPWPRLMLMSCAIAGPVKDAAAIRLTTNKTLRGRFADLTKAISDGPAAMPFRPRDFRSRPWRAAVPPAAPRCGAGEQAVRAAPAAGRRAARLSRRTDAAARPPAAAPSRQGSDRPMTALEMMALEMAAAAVQRCARGCEPAGPSVARGGQGAESAAR